MKQQYPLGKYADTTQKVLSLLFQCPVIRKYEVDQVMEIETTTYTVQHVTGDYSAQCSVARELRNTIKSDWYEYQRVRIIDEICQLIIKTALK